MSDMSEQPKAGEWYQDACGTRVVVVGMASKSRAVVEHECGTIGFMGNWSSWKRLEGCTGFDWIEDTFPQWLTFRGGRFADCAYLFRESKDVTWSVYRDGTRKMMSHTIEPIPKHWVRTRQDVAEALADQKPEVKPEMNPRELEFLEIVAKQRDTIDKLAKRLEKLEQAAIPYQTIGGSFR